MIVEHGLLHVVPGREDEFEAALAAAKEIVAASPGFRSLRVSRGVESPSTYLLLVEWDRLEDHTEGFRGSAAFAEWRRLVGGFWDPKPTIEHFRPVAEATPR